MRSPRDLANIGRTMKLKSKIALLLVAILVASGCTSVQSDRRVPDFDDSILDVIIPHIKLDKASIELSVQTIQAEWKKQIPGKELPLAVIIDYVSNDENGVAYEGYPGNRRTITLEADQISVRDCLELVSQIGGQRLRIRSGRITFESVPWIEEDWCTAMVAVSAAGQSFLRLASSTTPGQVTSLLMTYGIEFPEGLSARWVPESESIVITTLPGEISKLRALLWLLDNGFEIKHRAASKVVAP